MHAWRRLRPIFEPIHTTDDRVEAELFRTTLESHGLEVQVTGFADAALLGAAPGILPITLKVKTADVEAARALLQALQNPTEAEAEPPPEYSDPEPPETGRPRAQQRRPYFAAGLVFFLPGGGHLYARRPWTAAVLAVGWVVAIGLASSWKTSEAAGGLIALLLLVDMIGGVRAARTYNRGVDVGRGRQIAIGAALLVVAVGLSQGAAAIEAMNRARIARELGNLETTCTARTLTVTHKGPEPRFVSVAVLRVTSGSSLFGEHLGVARLEAVGPAQATLASGQVLTIGLKWLDQTGGAQSPCPGGSSAVGMFALDLPGRCAVEYAITVRATEGGRELAHGQWSCALP